MIYEKWEDIPEFPSEYHEGKFIQIIKMHGFNNLRLIIPLKARYTKGRRWSDLELQEAIDAWHSQKSITFVSACLNRNPQDMIYKLIEYCKSKKIPFTQKYRSEGSSLWDDRSKSCAQELFEAGLPAWKIAALFKVDFEHIEKEMFVKRESYGHSKKNPFSINTDHKQLVNKWILDKSFIIPQRVFEPFAGEGRFTKVLLEDERVNEVVCVEQDEVTIDIFKEKIKNKKVKLYFNNNLTVMNSVDLGKFDLVDLDPFVTCHEQIPLVWKYLNKKALLFVTFGGEYRRSFIKTNRHSIANRYGFYDIEIDNKNYLEKVPYFFLGYLAKQASENRFTFNVIRAVRYANNCRFWLEVQETDIFNAVDWLSKITIPESNGYYFNQLNMPRFKEVRFEIDKELKKGINL